MNRPSRYIVTFLFASVLQACGGESTEVSSADPAAGNEGPIERVDPALDALVPADATIEKLAGDFAFTEGPVWDRRNNRLLFSDLRSNAIHSWSDADGLGTFLQPVYEGDAEHESVGSNGLNRDQ